LLVGQGAALAGVDPLRGTVLWEVPLATPRGTNEVERLADLVGPAVRAGDRVCARAFQSPWLCATPPRAPCCGRATWAAPTPWRAMPTGVRRRRQRPHRRLAPGQWRRGLDQREAAVPRPERRAGRRPVVVFGDSEGQVHFLSTADGERSCACPPTASRSSARRCWRARRCW
jgi:outer membrane protein assembly factor BamB